MEKPKKVADISGIIDTMVTYVGDWILKQLKENKIPPGEQLGAALCMRLTCLARTMAMQMGVKEDIIVITMLAGVVPFEHGKYHLPHAMKDFLDEFYTKVAAAEAQRKHINKLLD